MLRATGGRRNRSLRPRPAPGDNESRMSQPPATPARLPDPDGDAPLHRLARDPLSVFLYTAFPDGELVELVKKLGISGRGFRPDALSDVELADVVADEILAVKARRKPVIAQLKRSLGSMVLPDVPLDPSIAGELCDAVIERAAIARFLWRVLADPQDDVRASAGPALARLQKAWYPVEGGDAKERPEDAGLAHDGADPAELPVKPSAALAKARAALAAAKAALAKAKKEGAAAGRERDKATSQLQKWRDELKRARAGEAAARKSEAEARKATAKAAAKAAELAQKLEQARARGGTSEATRLRKELERALHELEAKGALLQELAAKEPVAPVAPAPAPAPASSEPRADDELEEAPASWLLPLFSREFYDSLGGWDRRIQRAAFKQAWLLSQDHRHPSLRALPLEGVENLYRVRVATDVRLLYRRLDGNRVEILRLIDREDLDRHIKQQKERG